MHSHVLNPVLVPDSGTRDNVWGVSLVVCYFAYVKITLNMTLILSCSLILHDGINITKTFYQQTSTVEKEYMLQCIYT